MIRTVEAIVDEHGRVRPAGEGQTARGCGGRL